MMPSQFARGESVENCVAFILRQNRRDLRIVFHRSLGRRPVKRAARDGAYTFGSKRGRECG